MRKIVHIITGLGNGGAEMMLFKLLQNINKSKYDIEVVSMLDEGIMGEKIKKLGINVHCLRMKRGIISFLDIKTILKCKNIVKDADIIQTWMYHADLFGFIVGKLANTPRIIWGIRRANLDPNENSKSLILISKVNAYISKYVYKIVSCSYEATKLHENIGYDKSKFITIPNGFNLENYKKKCNSKTILCRELGLIENNRIICHVGRWNNMKDYETLLKSIKIVLSKMQNVKFILCGTNISKDNKNLMDLIAKFNVLDNIYLLGRREDVANIMSASNILVLSSIGEGFPNVVGEAMACETPCVVTNVGDCKFIVGEYGTVVEKKRPDQLSNAIVDMLNMDGIQIEQLGYKCRQRIIKEFDIHKIVKKYETLYE